jgi:hypothetical protein
MEAVADRKPSSVRRLEELRSFMAARRFIASLTELRAAGFEESRIYNWCRSGRLIPVARGVYSYGRDVELREAALRVALLLAGPGAALTGKVACEQWGIITPRTRIPRIIEVAVESGHTRTARGLSPALRKTEIRIFRRQFETTDVRRKDGLELTRAALALVDLAVEAGSRELRFAFLEACRLRHLDGREVKLCFRRVAGRRGAKKLNPLLALWIPELNRIRSVLEGLFLLAWAEREYPIPLVNKRLHGKEVDFYWPAQRFVLETDGHAFHSDPVQKAIDREKQRHLESNGETVMRMTYRQFDSNPDRELDQVATGLGLL